MVPDQDLQFTSIFWRKFCALPGATVSLSSGSHFESISQKGTEMETALCCLVSQNPASCSRQLLWVESAHNTLTTSATGLSRFQWVYGFQLLSFPPSADHYSLVANCHCSQALLYQVSQKVWHPTKDLSIRVESNKMTPKLRSVPLPKAHQPCSSETEIPQIYAHSTHFLRLQDQTCPWKSPSSSHSASSTFSPCERRTSLPCLA